MFALLGLVALSCTLVASAPLAGRASIDTSSYCGQYDTVTAGEYQLDLDQWGESGATSGSDCAQLTSLNGDTIAWETTWTWTGGTGVKSYTNIQLNDGINQQLSAISSMPTTWAWTQSSSGTVDADVAYDFFTSDTAGGSNLNEVMVWLGRYNVNPIATSYDSAGNAVPYATGLSLAGQTWDLYSGSNGQNQVYSFLLSNGNNLNSFSGDIYEFFQYLVDNEGVSSSPYLTTAQSGTEATSGSATLTTSAYSLAIN